MAAPVRVGTAGAVVASVDPIPGPTTLTPPTGSGYAVGDLLLCFTSSVGGFGNTVATPSGWTKLVDVSSGSSQIALFGKVAASTSEAAPSVVWTVAHTGTTGDPTMAQVAAFRGAASNLASIADVIGAVSTIASSFSQSAGGAGITTLTADDLVLSLTTRAQSSSPTTLTAPSGFTLVSAGAATTSGTDMIQGWASQAKATPGAVATSVFGFNGSTAASMGVMVALKTAPVVTNNDAVTGIFKLSGTVAESYVVAIIRSDAPTGAFKLSGSRVESYARDYSDARTGVFKLSGTCTSTHLKIYNDSPTGTLALSGTAARSSQHSATPVGSFKLSGIVTSTAAKTYTDVCAGVLALLGVKSETLAYTDPQTGRLVLNGTATSEHLAVILDAPIGVLRLRGAVNEYIILDGNIFYSDSPTGTLRLTGRLVIRGRTVLGGFLVEDQVGIAIGPSAGHRQTAQVGRRSQATTGSTT